MWSKYDAVELVKSSSVKMPILVDQGNEDSFLKEQLKPELLENACRGKEYPITLNMRDGYDHSYYFIASFVEDHINFHLSHLIN